MVSYQDISENQNLLMKIINLGKKLILWQINKLKDNVIKDYETVAISFFDIKLSIL